MPEQTSTIEASRVVQSVIRAEARDLGGGFVIARLLPAADHRNVGPFVFLDVVGPKELPPGQGLDVRPHPHIGLATVTYLLEGSFVHRDSLGVEVPIHAGDLAWMTSGRGIVHSERTGAEDRVRGSRIHAFQLWAALPHHIEEVEPSFEHRRASELPELRREGVHLRLLVGRGWGMTSPVEAPMPMIYADIALEEDTTLELPMADERALFLVSGQLMISGGAPLALPMESLVVLEPQASVTLRGGPGGGRAMMMGGAPLDGPRHLVWNFVASSRERIEQAMADWRDGRFPKIPTDPEEFIPLPKVDRID